MKYLAPPRLPALAADPGSPAAGDLYVHTTSGLKWYTGSAWAVASVVGHTHTPNSIFPNLSDIDRTVISYTSAGGYVNSKVSDQYILDGTISDGKRVGQLAPVRLVASNHGLSGLAAIDGVTPVAGDRIGVFFQSTGSQNGIYVAASGAWSRASDANTAASMARGTRVWSQEGTQNAGKEWTQVNTFAVLGTDTPLFRIATRTDIGGAFGYPPPYSNGHMFYDTNAQMLKVWDGFNWQSANGVMFAASTARPGFVTDDDILYETDTLNTYVWGGGAWNPIAVGWTKEPVRLATTANVASLSGNLTIDGFTTAAGDRILVKDQTTASQNGIYVASASAWTRAIDADNASELSGAVVYVRFGSTNLGTYWSTPMVSTAVVGTDSMPWNRMGPEVTVQNAQPSTAYDLWVDTDDYGGALGLGATGAWQALPLVAGYVEYNLANTPQFRVEPWWNGVRLRGWIKPASGNFPQATTNIAQLPSGAYNTSRFVDNACAHGVVGTTARGNTVRCEISNSNGNLSIVPSTAYDAFSWVSLDGWTYPLEA